jgi:hypothetical protein
LDKILCDIFFNIIGLTQLNPDQASIYVIPTKRSQLKAGEAYERSCRLMNQAFRLVPLDLGLP